MQSSHRAFHPHWGKSVSSPTPAAIERLRRRCAVEPTKRWAKPLQRLLARTWSIIGESCMPWNNYPPAKPEVLRLLAPQRGLTAIAKSKPKPEKTTNGRLPELSNFGSPPAEPGVYHD